MKQLIRQLGNRVKCKLDCHDWNLTVRRYNVTERRKGMVTPGEADMREGMCWSCGRMYQEYVEGSFQPYYDPEFPLL